MANAEWLDDRSGKVGTSEPDWRAETSSSEFDEAILVQAPQSRLASMNRIVIGCLSAVTIIFPLFLGGKIEVARVLVQTIIFATVAFTLVGLRVVGRRSGTTQTAQRFAQICLICSLIPLLQLVPMPMSLLRILSPETAAIKSTTGLQWSAISLDISSSLSALTWWIALLAIANLVMILPPQTDKLRLSMRLKSRKARRNTLLERAREIDPVVESCQTAVVGAATLAAVVSLIHVATGMIGYWGVFQIDPSEARQLRSHWPFINPNHLCVLLEMGCLLALTKFLRLSHLRAIRDQQRDTSGLGLRLLRQPERIGAEMWYLVLVLFLTLVSVLTFSRAGVTLLLLGITFLWLTYDRSRAQFSAYSRRTRDSRPSMFTDFFRSRFWRMLRMPLLMSVAVVFVLSFLGEGSRDLFAKRIEYGLSPERSELRWQLFTVTLRMFADFPLWGVGLSGWSDIAARYIGADLASFTLDFAHNDPLQLLAELGIFGAAAILGGVLWVLTRTFSTLRNLELIPQRFQLIGLGLALAIPIIHSLVEFPFHIPALATAMALLLGAHLRLIGCIRGEYRALREDDDHPQSDSTSMATEKE